jgi:hypothetical protein
MKNFMQAKDVMEVLGVSQNKAYVIIRELNNELAKDGYMTVQGKVNRKYFYKRFGLSDFPADTPADEASKGNVSYQA